MSNSLYFWTTSRSQPHLLWWQLLWNSMWIHKAIQKASRARAGPPPPLLHPPAPSFSHSVLSFWSLTFRCLGVVKSWMTDHWGNFNDHRVELQTILSRVAQQCSDPKRYPSCEVFAALIHPSGLSQRLNEIVKTVSAGPLRPSSFTVFNPHLPDSIIPPQVENLWYALFCFVMAYSIALFTSTHLKWLVKWRCLTSSSGLLFALENYLIWLGRRRRSISLHPPLPKPFRSSTLWVNGFKGRQLQFVLNHACY